jgi:3-oxoacyl-[acyl-carrier-protein] synthase III
LHGVVGSARLGLEELSARYDLTPGKIESKTGVTGLCRLAEGESLVDLAQRCAEVVLAHAGVALGEVRGVFGSSNPTGEDLIPTFTATFAQALGLREVIVDHVGIGCCGGLQALRNAHNQLVVDGIEGRASHCLVVAADHTSRILDPDRRHTGTLFGEGVSVALLTNAPRAAGGYRIAAIGTKSLLGDALHALRLRNPHAGHAAPLPKLEMDGRRVSAFGEGVFSHFLSLTGLRALPPGGYVVPHQPNLRMLEAMMTQAELDPAQVYLDGIRTVGNVSPAAALLGLEDALRRGLVGGSQPVLLGAFGAELQIGAALLVPGDGTRILHPAATP